MEKVWSCGRIINFNLIENKQFSDWLFVLLFLQQEELLKFQANLKRQLELIRMNSRPPPPPPTNNLQPQPSPGTNMPMSMPVPASMPMTMNMPIPSAPPYDRQNSNSSTSGNDDGWVLVPSQAESDAWNIKMYCLIVNNANVNSKQFDL